MIPRAHAWSILTEFTKSDSLRKHARAVEASMRLGPLPNWAGELAHRLARRRLMPSIATTITGISHQARTWLALRIALRTSPMKTATAIVQSSPTMKWYRNRTAATIHENGGGIG